MLYYENIVIYILSSFPSGIIGDWKKWFTVAQSEQFDQRYNKEMKDCSVRFIYDDKNLNVS